MSNIALVIAITTAFSATPAFGAGLFERNLRVGDRGIDVKALQELLNRDIQTRIALSGSGSVGFETEYFGTLTSQAVKRFQEKYASEVLTPLGLTSGTGFVGSATRAKLNAMGSPTVIVPPNTVNSSLTISEVSPRTIPAGSYANIHGSGFNISGSEVLLNDSPVATAYTVDKQTIAFQMPIGTLPGNYLMKVRLGATTSNPSVVNVTSPVVSTAGPKISNLTPSRGVEGTVMTINGSGFDKDNNTVYTGYSVLSGIPSADGKTITVTVAPHIPAYTTAVEIPLWFYVVNSSGESNEGVFTYTPAVNSVDVSLTPKEQLLASINAIVDNVKEIFSPPQAVLAAGSQGFGGPIQETQECHCSAAFWVKVGAPANSSFIIKYGSTQIYRYGQYRRAQINLLGTYTPGGQCRYTQGYPPCRETKTVQGGSIGTLGTSM